MDASHVDQLCRVFSLGPALRDPEPVPGGLLHTMWRLTTTQGTFAVKVLNPAIMLRPGVSQNYLLSEAIAAQLAARGIPAVAALSPSTGPLQTIDQATVLVYPWMDGETLSSASQDPERATLIGRLLGQIHATHLEIPELIPLVQNQLTFSSSSGTRDQSRGEVGKPLSLDPLEDTALEWTHFLDDDWDMLTYHAADQGLPWAYPARSLLPRLLEWCRLYEESAERLNHHLVVSHRDLDQKNVLWQDSHSPFLIDWEAAGLINPAMELAATALSWSGQYVGHPAQATFTALVRGYAKTGIHLTATSLDAMHGVMGIWLGWLLFNMRRSLGESTSSPEERTLGTRETSSTLTILRNLAEYSELWASWLDMCR